MQSATTLYDRMIADCILLISCCFRNTFRNFRIIHLAGKQVGSCAYRKHRHIPRRMTGTGPPHHCYLAHNLSGSSSQRFGPCIKTLLKNYFVFTNDCSYSSRSIFSCSQVKGSSFQKPIFSVSKSFISFHEAFPALSFRKSVIALERRSWDCF